MIDVTAKGRTPLTGEEDTRFDGAAVMKIQRRRADGPGPSWTVRGTGSDHCLFIPLPVCLQRFRALALTIL